MGTLAFGLGGAAIGSFFGQPQLGFFVGSLAGRALFGRSGNAPESSRLEDLSIQSSAYGAPRPIGWGTWLYAGNVIWQRPIRAVENEIDTKGGGATGPSTFDYFATFSAAFCQGPLDGNGIIGVRRIWADSKLIYDFSDNATAESLFASNQAAGGIEIHRGTATQEPSSLQEEFEGVGNVPGYTYTVYIDFVSMNVNEWGARVPSISAEIIFQAATESYLVEPPWPERPTVVNTQTPVWESEGQLAYSLLPIDDTTTNTSFTVPRTLWTLDGRKLADQDITYFKFSGENTFRMRGYVRGTGRNGQAENELAIAAQAVGRNRWVINRAMQGFDLRDALGALLPSGLWDMNLLDRFRNRVWVATSGTFTTLQGQMHGFDATESVTGAIAVEHDAAVTVDLTGSTFFIVDMQATATEVWILARSTGPDDIIAIVDTDGNAIVTQWTLSFALDTGGRNAFLVDTPVTPVRAIVCSGNSTAFRIVELPDGGGAAVDIASGVVDNAGSSITSYPFRLEGQPLMHHRGQFITTRLFDQGSVPISQIISDIGELVGLQSIDFDVTGVTTIIGGYSVTRTASARQALEPIIAAFLIDAFEGEHRLNFVERSPGAAVTIIPDEELGAVVVDDGAGTGDGNPAPFLIQTRKQSDELPRAQRLRYRNIDADHEAATQLFRLIDPGGSQNDDILDVPIVSDHVQMAGQAERIATAKRLARDTFRTALAMKWLALDIADVVSVKGRRGRIVGNVERIAESIKEIEIESDAAGIYETPTTPGDPSPPGGEPVPFAGPTEVIYHDAPLFRDGDDLTPHFLFTASGLYTGWPGAAVFRSTDGGTTFSQLASTSVAVTLGFAISALAAGPAGFDFNSADRSIEATQPWDTINTVVIRVLTPGRVLGNATAAEVTAGLKNVAFLGGEVIGWQTAVDNGDGTFTLSNILRGSRGTEDFIATHAINDDFAEVSTVSLRAVRHSVDDYDRDYLYRAPTFGQELGATIAKTFKTVGRFKRPFAPVKIEVTGAPAADKTITAIRRSRLGTEFRDFSADPPPLDAPAELYDVDIYDPTGPTLVRTFTDLATPSVVYTAVDQAADLGAAGNPFDIEFFQKNTDYPDPAANFRGNPGRFSFV